MVYVKGTLEEKKFLKLAFVGIWAAAGLAEFGQRDAAEGELVEVL